MKYGRKWKIWISIAKTSDQWPNSKAEVFSKNFYSTLELQYPGTHRGSNTVNAGAEHNDAVRFGLERHVVGGTVVGQVQVVGARGPFRRHRVDLFHKRRDAVLATQFAHFLLIAANACGELRVGEAQLFGAAQQFRRKLVLYA